MASAEHRQTLIAPHLGHPDALAAMQAAIDGGFAGQELNESALKRDIGDCVREMASRNSGPLSRLHLLFDANIKSKNLIRRFQAAGFKVRMLDNVGLNKRASDEIIATRASEHNYIVITFDRDYERIYRVRRLSGQDVPGVFLLPHMQGGLNHDPDYNPVMAQVVTTLVVAAQGNPDFFKGRLIEAVEQSDGKVVLEDIANPDNPIPLGCHLLRREAFLKGSFFSGRPACLG